ncbi:putative reverse transcriptase domain-containing protein [Tanacetum coccineum]
MVMRKLSQDDLCPLILLSLDAEVRFVLYDITKPQVPSSSVLHDHVDELVLDEHVGFTLPILDRMLSKGLRMVKSIPPKCRLGFLGVLKGDLDKENLDVSERNVKQCKRKICDGHYTAAVRVLSSSGVAPYNDATLEDLKAKHPLKLVPSLPHIPIDYHKLTSSHSVVLDMIKSFPRGTSCGRDGLRAQHLIDCLSGAVVAISDELVSSITQVMNLFIDGKCLKTLGEYIASASLTPLVKPRVGIRPIVVGTIWRRLVSKVCATMIGHSLDGYLNDRQFGVGVSGGGEAILHAVNHLIEDRGDEVGLSMLLVDFKNAFNLVDCEVMLQEVGTRYPAISRWVKFCYSTPTRLYYGEHTLRSYRGVQQGDPLGPLLFSLVLHPLVIIKDGPCRGLHLNVDKTDVFWPKEDSRNRLAVFPPNIARPLHGVKLLGGSVSANFDFSSELLMKRSLNLSVLSLHLVRDLVIGSGGSPPYPLHLEGLVSTPQLLQHSNIVTYGPAFDNALSAFNVKMEIDLLSNPSEVVAPKLMKKLADIYFTHVTQTAESTFTLVFAGDIYEDHDVSCTGIVGIKHRHNIVRDTLVDIYFRSGISAGKEVDIGLGGGRDKPLCPTDMLLYSWGGGLDVCMDLTGSTPLTQTGMIDFAPRRAVIDVAQHGGGNGLTKTSLIIHLRDDHCSGDAQAITKKYLSNNLAVFEEEEVRFLLYDITKPYVPSSSEQLEHVDDLGQVQHGGFTLALLDNLLSKCEPGDSLQLARETLAESSPSLSHVDEEDLDLGERNIKQCKRKICDDHYIAAVRVLSSVCVAPYNHATLEDLKTKHPFKPAPSLLDIPIVGHHLIVSPTIVLDKIKSFSRGTFCGRDGLHAQHLMDCLSGAAIAISDELVSSITQVLNLFLDEKCPKLLGEYIVKGDFY